MFFDHLHNWPLFLLERCCWGSDEAEVSLHLLDVALLVELFAFHQPVHDIVALPFRLYFFNPLDRLNGVLPQFPVVLNRNVPSLLEFERWVNSQLFSGSLAESLRPSGLPWVTLLLEKLVALRFAESENLAVISHKLDAVTWVYRR